MKTVKLKHIIFSALTLLLVLSSNVANSQEAKLSREEKKAIRKAELEYNYRAMDSLFTAKRFVLVADYLLGSGGERTSVTQALNFIRINVDRGVIQTGSNSGIGYNSVGGVTAEGTLGTYEVMKNAKSMSFSLRFGLVTQLGHFDVVLNVTAGNMATATVTGLSKGSLTWEGHIESIEKSRVFKGQNSY